MAARSRGATIIRRGAHPWLTGQGSLKAPKAKRVLIIDDHEPTRTLIRAVLEREKDTRFDVVEAATGAECLRAADTKGPFDLILLDVSLPDIDGFSLCRALRRVERDVPIIFITAKNDLSDYAEGRQAGGDSYLVKPISRTALRSAIALFTSIDRRRSSPDPPKT